MKTKKLYIHDVYLSTAYLKVVKIDGEDVAFDQTIFFPTGGGQSCDKGHIIYNSQTLSVSNVHMVNNIIWHTIPNHKLKIDDTVFSSIDWDYRFDNMQRHCGEHLISGVLFNQYQGINKGFHMGEKYMTLDVSFPSFTVDEFTWDMAHHVENCVNEIIWENLPIRTKFIDSKENTITYKLRKDITVDEEISIVFVGDIEKPMDCVACCGTHPSTTGQVGIVKIYKIEKNKGMLRFYFEAGKRAMNDYQYKHDVVSFLCNKFSASPTSLLDKITSMEKKQQALKTSYANVRNTLISIRVNEILEQLNNSQAILSFNYDDISVDDIINIGKHVHKSVETLLIISELSTNTALLFSNGRLDCGQLIKESLSDFQGRGGGNKVMARALFPNSTNLENFLYTLKKQCEGL